ncbi:bifunctional chorismate mutase/prephenate dehydratase [Ruminococcus sp.]|uniref:bifunctional chorismate mutase/prephenate dehydratase n=1 Tax=Ruminococcus sp. TaxID=41978 RepID=UPI0025FE940D|nr:bifunctional chorismate mutase/prephenate dehydratase [Ruminococcus sp.]MBQ8965486.1 chorismate mutase [Ruminococcus sp.]
MDLKELRLEINEVDKQLQELFTKRMRLCYQVAEYKIANDLPVFHKDREREIIDRVTASAPDDLKGATRVYFQTMMDISKCMQYQQFFADAESIKYKPLELSGRHTVAVPGTNGSYNHIACSNLFDEFEPVFHEEFEDIFKAVAEGEAEYGILPIVNSTAGSVAQTYDLMKRYDFKICAGTKLRISHCLAVKKGVKMEDIKAVYSHEQGLQQCSDFINEHGFKTHRYANTSLAAKFIRESDEPYAAICSENAANEFGLDILEKNIQNATENYTKFILISRETLKSANANTISVCLALPHQSSSLYRLLTKFSVAGLNLSMIESMPIANTDFDVVFYLDFHGNIDSPEVAKLLSELEQELSYFKFLGNYEEV